MDINLVALNTTLVLVDSGIWTGRSQQDSDQNPEAHPADTAAKSTLPIRIDPCCRGESWNNAVKMDDLPAPVRPQIPKCEPAGTVNETLSSAGTRRPGYVKHTLSKTKLLSPGSCAEVPATSCNVTLPSSVRAVHLAQRLLRLLHISDMKRVHTLLATVALGGF